jgi:hypothetical protein
MATDFERGDHVEWNSEAGRVPPSSDSNSSSSSSHWSSISIRRGMVRPVAHGMSNPQFSSNS